MSGGIASLIYAAVFLYALGYAAWALKNGEASFAGRRIMRDISPRLFWSLIVFLGVVAVFAGFVFRQLVAGNAQ